MHKTVKRCAAAMVMGVAVLGLSACSSNDVSESDLEKKVKEAEFADSVQCDGDLKGEVGATQTCRIDSGFGSTRTVTVTVTSVDDDTVHFEWN